MEDIGRVSGSSKGFYSANILVFSWAIFYSNLQQSVHFINVSEHRGTAFFKALLSVALYVAVWEVKTVES